LKDPRARERVRLAIDVADPALSDRITAALAEVEGLELVASSDEPDALVVAPTGSSPGPEVDIDLTARELQVLSLLAEGASNKEIARRLGISAHTAKFHVAQLLEKLDAVSRTDAVAHAARIGVLHL
jgi:DNA-binding CsgD family transcriptional regulator